MEDCKRTHATSRHSPMLLPSGWCRGQKQLQPYEVIHQLSLSCSQLPGNQVRGLREGHMLCRRRAVKQTRKYQQKESHHETRKATKQLTLVLKRLDCALERSKPAIHSQRQRLHLVFQPSNLYRHFLDTESDLEVAQMGIQTTSFEVLTDCRWCTHDLLGLLELRIVGKDRSDTCAEEAEGHTWSEGSSLWTMGHPTGLSLMVGMRLSSFDRHWLVEE